MQSKFTEIIYDIELQPGEALSLPSDVARILGPGHWQVAIRPVDPSEPIRDHTAFLKSYASEDEGLYDDYPAG